MKLDREETAKAEALSKMRRKMMALEGEIKEIRQKKRATVAKASNDG